MTLCGLSGRGSICKANLRRLLLSRTTYHRCILSLYLMCSKEATEIRHLHELTDCLIIFSTAFGSVSARYPGNGTAFVGALVTNFNPNKRQTTDVLGILNDVKKEVSAEEHKAKDGTLFGQCPVVSDTLIKHLCWNSKAGWSAGWIDMARSACCFYFAC